MSHRCVDVGNERLRRMLTKLRGGTVELKEETGRWVVYIPREDRTCPVCSVSGIEDVEHFILKCELCKEERKDLFLLLQRLGVEVEQQEDIQKTASILQVAAKEEGVARMIEKMWICNDCI